MLGFQQNYAIFTIMNYYLHLFPNIICLEDSSIFHPSPSTLNSSFFLSNIIFIQPMKKDFTYLPGDSEQNLRYDEPPEEESITTKKVILAIILLIMVGITVYNFNSVTEAPDYEDRFEKELEESTKVQIAQEKEKLNKIHEMYSKTEEEGMLCKVSLSDKAKERVSYGQPRPKNSSMKAVVIERKNAPSGLSVCAVTNGINIITNKTTTTAKNFLDQKQVYRWIVFIGLIDQVGDNLIRNLQPSLTNMNVLRLGEVTVDSNYEFITKYTKSCSSVVYLQNTFVVEPDKAQALVSAIGKMKEENLGGYVGFTQSVYNEKGLKKLQDLRSIDLNQIKQQKINEYIYVFDSKLLESITPLNFQHFNKYTLEQILINPILALTQKSTRLIPVKGRFHTFDEVVVQFKQFALTQPETISTCFVAYPTLPTVTNLAEIKAYTKAIKQMNAGDRKIVVVVYVPYNFGHEVSLFNVYQELSELQESNTNVKVRLRFQNKKAVSSIAAYESAHTYCSKLALMVTSRFNVHVDKEFFTNFLGSSSQKYHFYYSGKDLKSASQMIEAVQAKETERFNIQEYMSSLSQMQIFESEFLKMVNLWVLKSGQDQFYESEAAFVLPLLEMSGQEILGIKDLYSVSQNRTLTENEQKEMRQMQKYARWAKMEGNIIQPIPYNSLTNLDLRKGNLNQIPRIIHQVWFRDEEIPENIQNLQNSIKEVNKGYEYKLWRKQNLTSYDFPLSYALIARTLEYEWAYQKSYHAWVQALVSYEVLYNHGGIYIDLSAQAKKPLDPFLKYELFFAGFESHAGSYHSPVSFGRQIIGAKRFSYHMRFILAELITEQALNYDCVDFEAIVGGDVIRLSLTDDQIFTTVAFGFQLFNYDPFKRSESPCKGEVPCSEYEETYIILHQLA